MDKSTATPCPKAKPATFNGFMVFGIIAPLIILFILQGIFNLIASWTGMEPSLKIVLNPILILIAFVFIMIVGLVAAWVADSSLGLSNRQKKIGAIVSSVITTGILIFCVVATPFVVSPEEKAVLSNVEANTPDRSEISAEIQREYGYIKVKRFIPSKMIIEGTKANGDKEMTDLMRYRGIWIMYKDRAELMERINQVDAGDYPVILRQWSPYQ